MTRKTAKLTLQILGHSKEEPDVFEATILAEGVHNGLTFTRDEITKEGVAATFEGQPVNLDHSPAVEDEVGFLRNVRIEGGKLRGEIVLSPSTAKYKAAKAFIENRLDAGKPPEVSVGVFIDLLVKDENETEVFAVNLEGDHLALVTRGACGPADGCGVGLSKEHSTMCDEKTKALEARVVELTTTNKTNADEIARLTDENATLTKELDGYRATERTELAAKLTELTGEEPDADTPIAALRANVELAARVASKLKPAAKELERGQRKTRAAPAKLEDEDPRSEAARLFALGRAQLRR